MNKENNREHRYWWWMGPRMGASTLVPIPAGAKYTLGRVQFMRHPTLWQTHSSHSASFFLTPHSLPEMSIPIIWLHRQEAMLVLSARVPASANMGLQSGNASLCSQQFEPFKIENHRKSRLVLRHTLNLHISVVSKKATRINILQKRGPMEGASLWR